MLPEPAEVGAGAGPSLPAAEPQGEHIPLSALQHYLFCPRQCALIHVERQWAENRYTAEGQILHESTDKPGGQARRDVRVVTGMPIASRTLGIVGVADVVELIRDGDAWRPYPVEYKRGRPKAPVVGNWGVDEVQLCAQALCLEEMLGVAVPEGALFYGKTRRRLVIAFDAELRALTRRIAAQTRALLAAGRTPQPVYAAKRCDPCSLKEICRPKRLGRVGPIAAWLRRRIEEQEPPVELP